MFNRTRALEVLAWIESGEADWDQMFWDTCFAGLVVQRFGDQDEWDGYSSSYGRYALELLDLDPDGVDTYDFPLFHYANSIDDLRAIIDELSNPVVSEVE